jgi:hypothetical protein
MRISDYHRREQLNCLREARRVREGHPPCVPEEDESLESDASSPSAGLQQPYKASGTNWSRDESPSQAFWDLPKVNFGTPPPSRHGPGSIRHDVSPLLELAESSL